MYDNELAEKRFRAWQTEHKTALMEAFELLPTPRHSFDKFCVRRYTGELKFPLGVETTKRLRFSFQWQEHLNAHIAHRAPAEGFSMSLVGDEAIACQNVVNQGIDAHLEACFVRERGDKYMVTGRSFIAQDDNPPHWSKGQEVTHTRALDCLVSKESLPVLVRRLMESDDEAANSLASGICEQLNIELI